MAYIADPERYDTMKFRRIEKSGLKLPSVSLGLWHNFGGNEDFENMRRMIRTAFDCGITSFDIANNYGRPLCGSAEENFGRILASDLAVYRDELVITTKAGYLMWDGPYGDGGSRKYLISSLDQSLRRLGVDYVDIFYHHRPDPETPLEETMEALAHIVRSGKALYVGLSNYDGERMKRAAEILESLHTPFVVNQNRLSILDRSAEDSGLLDASRELGRGVVAFSPLAQGILAGRYLDGIPADSRVRTSGIFLKESSITEQKVEKSRALFRIAKERGETLAQMSLAWVLNKAPVVSVIIGASSPEQIKENVSAADYQPFTAEQLAEIDKISLA